ncbi:hypothetical protein HD806DRAFT_523658 [Xylariaceae sp. AK1471]|nr:hypothetical protein HD806DRAFT_523658 [Xylariaceae sp. AK1471]
MCYSVSHLCRICLTIVRIEQDCNGLCYVAWTPPFSVDEYCVAHRMDNYPVDEFMPRGDMTYPDAMYQDTTYQDTTYENLMHAAPLGIDATHPETAYAESVSEYAVEHNTVAPERSSPAVADWLTTLEDESLISYENPTDVETDVMYWNTTSENPMMGEMEAVVKGLDSDEYGNETITGDGSVVTDWTTAIEPTMVNEMFQELNRGDWTTAVEDMGEMGHEGSKYTE